MKIRHLLQGWFPTWTLAGLLTLAGWMPGAQAHETHDKMDAAKLASAAPAPCAPVHIRCGRSATPVFGPGGKVWVLWSLDDRLYLSTSEDGGVTFPTSRAISEKMPTLDDNSEARPKLALMPDGSLFVAVTQRDSHYIGRLFTARSTDGGKTFSPLRPLLGEPGQRFETPLVLPSGRLVMAWLDLRNQKAAKARGQVYKDTGVAVAWSDDNGQTFQGKSILADYSCDCCRLGAAVDTDGQAVFTWRHVFDGTIRDHAAAKLNGDGTLGPLRRVAVDGWKLDACPRHGPSISTGTDGTWHVTWFTGAPGKAGVYYARSTDQGATFSPPEALGSSANGPARPQVLAAEDGRVWRLWKEFDGQVTTVLQQVSADKGLTWGTAREVGRTKSASDHPLLVQSGRVVYLSWLTRDEGYRLLPLNPSGT